jgi:hypothetical protein
MRTKLIKIKDCDTCKEVLITIIRDSDNNDFLSIQAWHLRDKELLFQFEEIYFNNNILLECFVDDFSKLSAEIFAGSFEF